jgi:hypothetical protein
MADRRERWDDLTEVHHAGVERHLDRVWTALPCKVIEDTAEGHTVKLQPTIKGRERQQDGTIKQVDMPELPDVPIQYAAGGGFTITHPIKKDDEGIVVFASRCIDGWWDKGGNQPPLDQRKHNLSDGMYIPGIRSKPRKLGGDGQGGTSGANGGAATPTTLEIDLRSNGASQPKTKKVSLDSLQIRTDKGDYYIELTTDTVNIICKNCNIVADETVQIQCKELDVKASGKIHFETPTLEVTGDIKAGGDVTAHDSVSSVSMTWRATAAARDATTPVPGVLSIKSVLPNMVGMIGDQFNISGAVNLVAPALSGLLNGTFSASNILDSFNFETLLSALPGQLGQIGGSPMMQAVIHLVSHDHHGVRAGPDISQKPVTGT